MSDIKARAEARRAKILARDKRTVRTNGEGGEEDALSEVSLSLQPPASGEKVIRPLAARKLRIEEALKATNATEEGGEVSINNTISSRFTEELDVGDDTPPEEDHGIDGSIAPDSKVVTDTPSDGLTKRAKTVSEIEEEVRQRTAEFDERQREQGGARKDKTDDKGGKRKGDLSKAKALKTPSVSSSAVMRLFRAMLLIALGMLTGFRAVSDDPTIRTLLLNKYAPTSSTADRLTLSSKQSVISGGDDDGAGLEGDDFVAYQTLTQTSSNIRHTADTIRSLETEKTWSRWVSKKVRKQVTYHRLEITLSDSERSHTGLL
jgi:hypothetical protein